VIHNAAFVALGLDWVYVPLPVAPAELPAALEGLGALGFAGANVTMPHKTSTAELIDDLSEDARLLLAVNTIVVGANGLAGHNSDAAGFERFLRDDVGFDAAGRSALLFGAGGGARACALAAARSGLADLSVAVREASRADDLRAALEGSATAVHLVGFDDSPGVEADLIVNATPLGVHGEELPLPSLHAGVVGVDLLYRPGATPFQTAVRDAGGAAFGGLGLLLQQAAISFELWTGRSAPLPVMSAAALGELAEPGPAAPGATGTA
jgi:shikimate dehydrogenase